MRGINRILAATALAAVALSITACETDAPTGPPPASNGTVVPDNGLDPCANVKSPTGRPREECR